MNGGWKEITSVTSAPCVVRNDLQRGSSNLSLTRTTSFSGRTSRFIHKGILQAKREKQKVVEGNDFHELLQSELSTLQEALEKSSEKLLAASKQREDKIMVLEREHRVRQVAVSQIIRSNRSTPRTSFNDGELSHNLSTINEKVQALCATKRSSRNGLEAEGDHASALSPRISEDYQCRSPLPGDGYLSPRPTSQRTSVAKEPQEKHPRSQSPHWSSVLPGSVPHANIPLPVPPVQRTRSSDDVDDDDDDDEPPSKANSFMNVRQVLFNHGCDEEILEDDEIAAYFSPLAVWSRNLESAGKSATVPSLTSKARGQESIRNLTFKFRDLIADSDKGAIYSALQSWAIHPGSLKRAWWEILEHLVWS